MEMFDVVAVGALNLDYIAPAPPLSGVAWGAETAVDARTVRDVLDLLDPTTVTVSAGGSSFNVAYTLAHLRAGLSIGYLGVAGTPVGQAVSGLEELRAVGVDVSAVGRSSRLPGVCLALTHEGDRTLLTHIGANVETAAYLDERFDELVAYLARARVVHVTSFLDRVTPGVLLRLLAALRRMRPEVVIALDPGHVWCAEPTPDILGIIGLTDLLFVNEAELCLLAGHLGIEDEPLAAGVRGHLRAGRAVVVVKSPAGIALHGADGERRVPQKTLAPGEIVDSTGAGDVLAAGLLAMLVAGSPAARDLESGAALGLMLVRHKLRHLGAAGHGEFAALARPFVTR
ncbi:carbohydrate kinase family protein [Kineosporia mesophila]|uniref:Carbohydrate kinase family protein n=1 Tax=Kineosporia mesophila TaxID=566012 RepID=A0ABP6Z0I9_9ACTN|nr:carbohydrate kinase family protein [Kineosporia mesophila]MCD5351063.1 carbohydrate kinase family protein [Kineosporia mesophila]